MTTKTCTVDDCTAPHKGRGYCNRHLIRARRYGDPLMSHGYASDDDRFWSKVDKSGPVPAARPDLGPCWQWTASLTRFGYGQFALPGAGTGSTVAYRWAWDRYVGPVPAGLQLDHLCRNRLCVRTDHLEVVTKDQNNARGDSPTAINARKTHCLRGHELTPENTYSRRDRPGRDCRACRALRRPTGAP